ncbi:MAG: VCBS repeat-containing protein [Deltaproteobacteria bacterium]|nr:VCBS repeat-containing protein [Deltaproteobacteria bacterium]
MHQESGFIGRIAGAALSLVMFAGISAAGAADLSHQQHVLTTGDLVRSVRWADFNGDGLLDIVAMRTRLDETTRTVEKYFDLFLQTRDGFPKTPDQSVRASDRAVVYDVGNFDPATPGPDIGFISSEGVFAYSFSDGRLSDEPQRIITVRSVFTAPDRTSILSRELLRDYTGDGTAELMVPDADQWYLFKLMPVQNGAPGAHEWRIHQIFPVPLDTELSSIWEGNILFARLEFGSSRVVQLLPQLFLADFDGDRRKDLWVARDDRLLVFRATEDGNFDPAPEMWDFARFGLRELMRHGHIAPLTRFEVGDIDGDGHSDVVISKVSINDLSSLKLLSEIYVYRNRGGKFPASPDQTFHVKNFTEQPRLIDTNADGKLDLVYQEIPFSIWQAIRIKLFGRISVDYHAHHSKDGIFSDDPDECETIPFKFDLSHQGSGLLTSYLLDGDFNGDGRPDLLQSEGPGSYRICLTTANKGWASDCGRIKVPKASFFTFAVDLNGDQTDDLVVRYGGEDAHDGTVRVLLSK